MMCALVEIAIHHAHKSIYTLLFSMSKGTRGDCLRVGDTVKSVFIG